MAGRTVLFDASVLYAAPVRDLLLELALSDLFRAKWTEQINDEWMSHLLANRPDLTAAQLARTRALMQAHVRDCLVEDYEALIDTLTLPDPDDRHVLAAAIICVSKEVFRPQRASLHLCGSCNTRPIVYAMMGSRLWTQAEHKAGKGRR